jgi:hypothetical protein
LNSSAGIPKRKQLASETHCKKEMLWERLKTILLLLQHTRAHTINQSPMLINFSGTLLTIMLTVCSFYSLILLLTGRFRTHFIMPAHETDSPDKGRIWFKLQAAGLLLAALITAARTWQYSQGYTDNVMNNLIYAVSAFLLLRAVGEFRYMGLFKTEKSTTFSRIDTRFLTPLAFVMFLLSIFLL